MWSFLKIFFPPPPFCKLWSYISYRKLQGLRQGNKRRKQRKKKGTFSDEVKRKGKNVQEDFIRKKGFQTVYSRGTQVVTWIIAAELGSSRLAGAVIITKL